jgi:hypothetical protein
MARIPFVRRDDDDLRPDFADNSYPFAFLLRRSALLNVVDDAYDRFEANPERDREVSLRLIRRFVELCKRRGVTPVIAGIWPHGTTSRVLEEIAREGVRTVDIGVRKRRLAQNRPCNLHPSPAGHRWYADHLEVVLRSVLSP